MGGRLLSLDALIGTVRNAESLSWDLYANANPTRVVRSRTKLSSSDVTYWRYITIDLDPTASALVPPELPAAEPAAHCIFSGRGYQYWMPMRPRLACGVGGDGVEWIEHEAAERIMKGYVANLASTSEIWAPGWKVDTACTDLARVVRCPGSVNQKTGARSVVLSVVDSRTGHRWPLPADLVRFAVAKPEPAPIPSSEIRNLADVLSHLTVRARTFILYGAESPGRHSACYATCKTLYELGVPVDRASDWLSIGARNCSPCLDTYDVERVIKQVYGR